MFNTSTSTEAPFLVGIKGRNISLIYKYTGMSVVVKGEAVFMKRARPAKINIELAWKMALSASCGGILRWFLVPNATKEGYPPDREAEFQAVAARFDCDLELLRSRRGHMCLMLLPRLEFEPQAACEVAKPVAQSVQRSRETIRACREEMLTKLLLQARRPAGLHSPTPEKV